MHRLGNPRTILLAAGTAALTMAGQPAGTQPTDIRGTIVYENGKAIPRGVLQITLEDAAVQTDARARPENAQIDSKGDAIRLAFAIPAPRAAAGGSTQIVAQLLREDGWLLARGSAEVDAAGKTEIILYTVMY